MLKQYHVSKNLIDITQSEQGGIDASGNLVSGTTLYRSTVYTPINATMTTWVRYAHDLLRLYFYESDKTFISRIEIPVNTDYQISFPQDTAYIKWSAYKSGGIDLTEVEYMSIMLNEGSSALPYEPSDVKHDTLTTLPSTIYTNGTPLNSWSIYGAMSQSGTPSPSAPIYPQEVGDKTAQLIPEIVQGGVSANNGAISSSSNRVRTDYVSVVAGKTYTVYGGNLMISASAFYNNGVYVAAGIQSSGYTKTFTVPKGANQTAIGFRNLEGTDITPSDISGYMLNEGSYALPYEPYGVKFPIVSGGTTTTVYSAEAIRAIGTYVDIKSDSQEDRVIKKLVLTGQENWRTHETLTHRFEYVTGNAVINTVGLSSHYIMDVKSDNTYDHYYLTTQGLLYMFDTNYSDATSWKAYLAAQYAAGTPVCVWYVPSTATTTSVTTPAIPTSFGENIINVGTTLTPPRVDVSYTQYPWHEIPYYLYGTEQETVTELPTEIMADGNNAIVSIYGNMSQSGTPSPSSPVYPHEVGDRTANLFDTANMIYGSWTGSSGGESVANYAARTQNLPASSIVVSVNSDTIPYSYSIVWVDSNDTFIQRDHIGSKSQIPLPQTFSPPNDAVYFYMQVSCGATQSDVMTKAILDSYKIMLNTGDQALPYQPYGYIIPIPCGNVTTKVWLGDVSSTRVIKKLVLTGEEDWIKATSSPGFYFNEVTDYLKEQKVICICSHYEAQENVGWIANVAEGKVCFAYNTSRLYIRDGVITELAAFETYLQQQHANGTPVTVWYVLAAPVTEVLNEPLRKIGNYVDTAAISSVPTIDGKQTFDIQTTLEPSQVDITYHGWHKPYIPKKFSLTESTITTLPTTIYTGGTSLNSYKIYGAMTQSGTPSPSNPIYPIECGDKTANLFDYKTAYAAYLQPNGDVSTTGVILNRIPNSLADYIGETVTISIYCKNVFATRIFINAKINNVDIQGSSVYRGNSGYLTLTVTPQTLDDRWFISYGSQATGNETLSQFMLNTGSTALPYVPYGVKFPVECGNTTTPIYSTEPIRAIGNYVDWKSNTQEYRAIRQLVLTGQESTWAQDGSSSGVNRYRVKLADALKSSVTYSDQFYSSHYERQSSAAYSVNKSFLYNGSAVWCYMCVDNTTYPTVDDYKTYLAAQYAAGTPVTIWYVLASPTTTPIEAPTIPTIQDTQVFDVNTTLPPSKVELEYHDWQ